MQRDITKLKMVERRIPTPRRRDPYRTDMKPKGTPRCPVCQAICVRGRWNPSTGTKAKSLALIADGELKCPACRQEEDHYALGVIEIGGNRWKEMKDEILRTIERTEKLARLRNDQERVLSTEILRKGMKVYVTLPELARRMGRELEKSFKGLTRYIRAQEEPFLRVHWMSDLSPMFHEPGSPFDPKLDPKKAMKKRSSKTSSKAFRHRGG